MRWEIETFEPLVFVSVSVLVCRSVCTFYTAFYGLNNVKHTDVTPTELMGHQVCTCYCPEHVQL